MNPSRFFMPNMGMSPMMRMGSGLGINSMISANSFTPRFGLFNRIINGIKGFNWSGLLNGANKTLNVVNQTIPLIRQTKPIVNNVRNMIHLAKAFRSETGSSKNEIANVVSDNSLTENITQKNETVNNNNHPNFFI